VGKCGVRGECLLLLMAETQETSKAGCLSLEYVSALPVEQIIFVLLRGKGVNQTNRFVTSVHFYNSKFKVWKETVFAGMSSHRKSYYLKLFK